MKFKLSDNFIEKFKDKKPPFGFNGLGEITYLRTYSRIKEDGSNEVWWETVRRVVEGTYNMQKDWIEQHQLGWNPHRAQKSAQEMFDRMFNMKFLPPGRGLWAMGSPITEEKKMYAALNNCAFVSTENLNEEPVKPFLFLMDMSMLGVGVGFDVKGAGKVTIKGPNTGRKTELFEIPDSREGWVDSLKLLLESYFHATAPVDFDYSKIREAGLPIKGFGGKTSGPDPLKSVHAQIRKTLDKEINHPISITAIVDIMNLIGVCVVAGNVRRTAEIVFGPYDENEYLDLKNYKVNKDRADWGWTSNNSIFCDLGMDYKNPAERTKLNGEPGYAWLENMKAYSRMNAGTDNKDHRVTGGNPCMPSWSKLLTKDGIREMKDVSIGDFIWSKEGWTKVLNKWSTGVKKVFKYKTSSGVFYGTENHKIVSQGEKIEVKSAESIDIIRGVSETEYQIDPKDVMDGLVIGDGSVHKASNNLVHLLIGKDDQDYFDSEIKDLILKHRPGLSHTSYEIETTIDFSELSKTFDRKIPTRFLEDKNKLVGFLRGLYSANGSVCGDRITLKSASEQIVEDAQLMLNSIGIKSYITTNKPTKVKFVNGEYLCKISYDLNITSDRMKFKNCIGFIQNYKNKKIMDLQKSVRPEKISYDIQESVFVSEEEVFDLTVDNSTHTFWTQGCDVSNCLEQSLESFELCCLVETFPHNCENLEDYKKTLKYAYLYAKTVTLGKTHWAETNRVMLRNRRIGCSMSGIAQFVNKHKLDTFKTWCEEGYEHIEKLDEIYSDWFAIPKSIKKTSIKPSGTVSLLAGATPGMHWPESRYYIRRMRIAKNSELIQPLIKAGYHLEPSEKDPDNTWVVEIPVDVGDLRPVHEVSIWEQMSMAAFLQKYWADNQVSCTVTFVPNKEGDQIEKALNFFQYQLKGISFLPKLKHGAYAQMPYEEISEEVFHEKNKNIKKLKIKSLKHEEANVEVFCDTEKCELKPVK